MVIPHYETSETACDSFEWEGNKYYTSGNHNDTVMNGTDIDHITTLHLTINHASEPTTLSINDCHGYEWFDEDGNLIHKFDEAESFTTHLTNIYGCDSTVTIDFTPIESMTRDTTAYACDEFSWRGNTYSLENGNVHYDPTDGLFKATDAFTIDNPTPPNCEAQVILHLTLYPFEYGTDSDPIHVCDSILLYGQWIKTSGDYQITPIDPGYALANCSEPTTLHVEVSKSVYKTVGSPIEPVAHCESYTWEGETWTEGYHEISHTYTKADGCDSTETQYFHVYPAYNFEDATSWDTIISCNPSVSINGIKYDKSGTYAIHFESIHGCDSIVKKTILLNNPAATSTSGQAGFVPYEFTIDCMTGGDIYDTLDFGECEMVIPLDGKKPTVTHHFQTYFSNYLQDSIQITNDAPADETFDLGNHVITWTATDPCGNTVSCSKTLHVAHKTCPPAIDNDGNVYESVYIDCDCWTKTNLISRHYDNDPEDGNTTNGDGTPISGDETYTYEGHGHSNPEENRNIYGDLYSWDAAIGGDNPELNTPNSDGHVQGICPKGWYLPTAEKYERLLLHGTKELRSPEYWISGGGNNSTGFSALPGGYYDGTTHSYYGLGAEANFWSTSYINNELKAYKYSELYWCSEPVLSPIQKEGLGYSVRCVKEKEKLN